MVGTRCFGGSYAIAAAKEFDDDEEPVYNFFVLIGGAYEDRSGSDVDEADAGEVEVEVGGC